MTDSPDPTSGRTARYRLLFGLLRFPNLVIIVLTQGVVYFYILRSSLVEAGLAPTLSVATFGQLSLATVLVSAGGYLINDLFDRTPDRHNSGRVPAVERFGLRRGWWLYGMLTLAGAVLSIALAYQLQEWKWLWLYPASILLLAAYSPYIKPRPFWGNLLVAFYCAGVPGLIWLGERHRLERLTALDPAAGQLVEYTLSLFLVFAFLVTLLRELVKDLEDLPGDRAAGRRTLAVFWGEAPTRQLSLACGAGLAVFLPLSLGWLAPPPATELITMVGILLAGLCFLLFRLSRARSPAAYRFLSRGLKWYMLGGLLFLLLFRWYR